MEEVTTIKAGCPACKADIKGTSSFGFLCTQCMLKFSKEEIDYFRRKKDPKLKKHFSGKNTAGP